MNAAEHTGLAAVEPRAPAASRLASDAAACRLVDALVAAGVDTFFGIPGGPAAPLFEAIRLHPAARLVESRQESAAGFAAATFQRASGRVPALVVTAGPGITNAVTGIVSAHLEGVPLLVLSGDVAWAARGAKLAQDSGPEGVAIEQMLRACTRAQLRVARPESAATQALEALQRATDPRDPGPAVVVVPIDRANGPAPLPAIERGEPCYALEAPARAVEKAASWLHGARRPLVVLGAGCRPFAEQALALVDALDAPFVTTPRAKGVVSEEHPLSLRNAGMAASLWARRYTAEPVDVALVLGSRLDDITVGPTPYLGQGGRLIHVDRDATVFHRSLPAALALRADLRSFMCALRERVEAGSLRNPHGRSLAARARSGSAFDVAGFRNDARSPLAPHRALADLEAAVGPDARFISDIGEHMLFCLHYLTARDPLAFHVQLELGSMGSGIAGAVGLGLADPRRRVVCVCGDGGMQMMGMEALVAERERLPILFAVFNDARYNMVHHGMKQIFGAADPWETPPIDFCAWARALGMPSRRITTPGEIDAALLDDLLGRPGPALLDIRIDREVRIRSGGRVEALVNMSMLESGGTP